MSVMWRLSKGIFEASAAAQRGITHSVDQSVAQRQANRGFRAARTEEDRRPYLPSSPRSLPMPVTKSHPGAAVYEAFPPLTMSRKSVESFTLL